MSRTDIIRAWKDRAYRNRLDAAQRNALPENPAGTVELPDDVVRTVSGGGDAVVAANGGVSYFITASWLCNCRNVSKAMSVTSTCCCYSL